MGLPLFSHSLSFPSPIYLLASHPNPQIDVTSRSFSVDRPNLLLRVEIICTSDSRVHLRSTKAGNLLLVMVLENGAEHCSHSRAGSAALEVEGRLALLHLHMAMLHSFLLHVT